MWISNARSGAAIHAPRSRETLPFRDARIVTSCDVAYIRSVTVSAAAAGAGTEVKMPPAAIASAR